MSKVYVGLSHPCLRNKNWPYDSAAHLFADDIEELHEFAKCLGLKRGWFQSNNVPHYDLTNNKRIQALKLGAVPITVRQEVRIIRKQRMV